MENTLPTSQAGPERRRIFWMDAARALSISLVAIYHAMSRSYPVKEGMQALFRSTPVSAAFAAAINAIAHMSIPIFLMLSGALLLGRDYSRPEVRKRFLRHNWLRLFLIMELWQVIRFLFFFFCIPGAILGPHTPGSAILGLLKALCFYQDQTYGPIWYLAMILCIYPLIPILGAAIRKLPGRYLLLPAGIVILFAVLVPNLKTILAAVGVETQFQTTVKQEYLFPVYLIYVVLGWYLGQGVLARLSTGRVFLAFAVGFVLSALFQLRVYAVGGSYSLGNTDVGVMFSSVALFELLRRIPEGEGRWRRPVRSLSRCSMGVYFIHILVMTALDVWNRARPVRISGVRCLALHVAVGLLGSFLFVWLTSRIPFFRRWLYHMDEPRQTIQKEKQEKL